MSKSAHTAHCVHTLLEKTTAGHQVTAAVAGTTIAAAKVVGGTALAASVAAVAPIAIPLALAIGAGAAIAKFCKH